MSIEFIPAAVAILVRNNSVLMIKREKPPFKNLWSLPGGKIRAEEFISQTVVREVSEEVGIECSVLGYLGTVSEKVFENKKIARNHIIHVFEISSQSEKINKDCEWIEIGELEEREDITPSDIKIVENLFLKKTFLYFDCELSHSKEQYRLKKFVPLSC